MTEEQVKKAAKLLKEIDLLENRKQEIQSGLAIRSTLRLSFDVVKAGEAAMIEVIQTEINSLQSDFEKL